MKQTQLGILAFLAFFLFATTGWAQQRDTITIDRKGKKIQIEVVEEEKDSVPQKKITLGFEKDKKEKSFDPWKTRWLLLDVGFASYLYGGDTPSETFPESDFEGSLNPMEQRIWGSWNLNLHLLKTRLSLHKNYISLMSGLSFEYFQYGLENEVSMRPRSANVEFDYTGIDYDRNSLRAWYVTVPLMFNIETNPKKSSRSFRLGAGGFVGLRLSTNYREKWDIFDNKTRNNFNFNQFRYGVNAQIGYGWVTLYGNLALNGLFDADNNDVYDLLPINVGVQLVGF